MAQISTPDLLFLMQTQTDQPSAGAQAVLDAYETADAHLNATAGRQPGIDAWMGLQIDDYYEHHTSALAAARSDAGESAWHEFDKWVRGDAERQRQIRKAMTRQANGWKVSHTRAIVRHSGSVQVALVPAERPTD